VSHVRYRAHEQYEKMYGSVICQWTMKFVSLTVIRTGTVSISLLT